jgi:hypothetical protein
LEQLVVEIEKQGGTIEQSASKKTPAFNFGAGVF